MSYYFWHDLLSPGIICRVSFYFRN